MNTQQIGQKGENIASNFLQKKGYKILVKNYRYRKNEIDLIAQKDDLLVFVEVKLRSSLAYGMPEESLSEAQKKRIIETAETYIFEENWQNDIRFDIMAISDFGRTYQIHHFEDAFF